MRITFWSALAAAVALAVCGACGNRAAAPPPATPVGASPPADTAAPAAAPRPASPLAGTSWTLVELQSMDDATGVRKPNGGVYTMQLNADGTVSMQLNCNRANGRWSSEASADPSSGRFEFGPLAATRAFCPPPSLDQQIAAHAQYVRSYLLRNGRLSLSLMADGGIWLWEPSQQP